MCVCIGVHVDAGDTEKEIETLQCVPPSRYYSLSFGACGKVDFLLLWSFRVDCCFRKQHKTRPCDLHAHILPMHFLPVWHHTPLCTH